MQLVRNIGIYDSSWDSLIWYIESGGLGLFLYIFLYRYFRQLNDIRSGKTVKQYNIRR